MSQQTLSQCLRTFRPEEAEPTAAGSQFFFLAPELAPYRYFKLSCVRPGTAQHAPHRHEGDEFLFILEGRAEFFLDGETQVAGSWSCLFCPSGSLHGLRNAGPVELKYLVIR